MENDKNKRVPTLEEYMGQFEFNRPNYFDNPRTPEEMKERVKLAWRTTLEDRYLKLYGDLPISSMMKRKEGE